MNPSSDKRDQKFRHAFCHRATDSRYCVKAELTFDPFCLMKGVIYILLYENLKIQTRVPFGALGE